MLNKRETVRDHGLVVQTTILAIETIVVRNLGEAATALGTYVQIAARVGNGQQEYVFRFGAVVFADILFLEVV